VALALFSCPTATVLGQEVPAYDDTAHVTIDTPIPEEPAGDPALPPPEDEPADPPPEDPLPSDPPPADPAPVEEAEAEEPPPPPDPEAQPEPEGGTLNAAENESTIFQIIWQIQEGCRAYCHGTSQAQDASQRSETTQNATAGGTDASKAVNKSRTIQFVWQEQLGCVAFCYDTSQTQSASQWAQTTQVATAIGDAVALALNFAETSQFVWQFQRRCEVECHGTSASQSASQEKSTSQSATATTESGASPPDGPDSFFGWLVALADSIGATVQTVTQHQKAGCLEHCVGGSQVQEALQDALTAQTSVAGPEPAEPTQPPPASQQPEAGSPEPPPDAPAQAGGLAIARVEIGTPGSGAPDAARSAPADPGETSMPRSGSFDAVAPERSRPEATVQPQLGSQPAPSAATPGRESQAPAREPSSRAKSRAGSPLPPEPTLVPAAGLDELAASGADDGAGALPRSVLVAALLILLAALASFSLIFTRPRTRT
jgi:outer membrane biosynthesis protein TonB